MSHTHTNLLVHIVFSTQGRLPQITAEIKAQLFAYMGGLVKELKGKPIIINGVSDHVAMGQREIWKEVCVAEGFWSVQRLAFKC